MKYKYIGDGAGIPGLPHEITDEEAAARGLTVLLKDAVEAGKYVSADEKNLTPRPSLKGKGAKKESEVNDG